MLEVVYSNQSWCLQRSMLPRIILFTHSGDAFFIDPFENFYVFCVHSMVCRAARPPWCDASANM